MHTMDRGL